MKNLTFITTNQSKADYLAKWLHLPVAHQELELPELQSLDLSVIVEHKTRAAYTAVGKPVLVEDVSFSMGALGALPGPLIRWFLAEIGLDHLCKIATMFEDKRAIAATMYGLFDGETYRMFEGITQGKLTDAPREFAPDNSWKAPVSWNRIFIPEGSTKAYCEMTDDELEIVSHRAKAISKLREYLASQNYGR